MSMDTFTSAVIKETVYYDCWPSIVGGNSIIMSVDGVGPCTFQNWQSDPAGAATFACNVGSTAVTRTVRCSVDTVKSYQKGADKTTTINVQAAQTCSDGTPYNTCSSIKPKYCSNGTLIDNCQTCSCETGKTCQTNGTCAPAGTVPTDVIVRGRMIDAITGEPWANLVLYRTSAVTDSNGYFNFIFNTDNFTTWSSSGNLTTYDFAFAFWPSCGYQGGITIRWNSTKERFVGFSSYLDACEFRPFSSTNEIDLGTFKLWPAAAITIESDVPFKTLLHPLPNTCPTYTKSIGSVQYALKFQLANTLPVNHRTEIELTFQNGSKANTTSDVIKMEQKCQTVQLNYYNGQFSWGNASIG